MRRISFIVLLQLMVLPLRAPAQLATLLARSLKDTEAWAREDTNDASRQYYLALRHWKEHHWKQTDSLLRLSVQIDPWYADAYYALYFLPYARRTQLASEENRDHIPHEWRPAVDEAHEFFRRAFRLNPLLNLNVMGVAYEVEEPIVHDYTSPAYQYYAKYWAWFVDLGLGRYGSAYDRLNTLARREWDEPKHPERVPDGILFFRGLAAAHTMQYDKATGDFVKLLSRVEQVQQEEIVRVPLEDNDYRFVLATIHRLAGHTDSAVALYQQALEHDLGLVMAHTYLANIYEESNRAADALLERKRAAEVDRDDPVVLFDLAASLFNAGQLTEADEPLRHAIKVNPRFSPSYYLLGRLTEELGLPDEARDQYQKFLALSPLRSTDMRADVEQRLGKLK
jgi:tetratricopeptide (TPR) repeat protein